MFVICKQLLTNHVAKLSLVSLSRGIGETNVSQRLLNSTRLLIGEAKRTGNPWIMFTDPDVPIGYK